MKTSYTQSNSGRMFIASIGIAFVGIAIIAFGALPIVHPVALALPLLLGACGIWSVGFSLIDDDTYATGLLVIAYPFLGCAFVAALFIAPTAGVVPAFVFGLVGIALVAKAAWPRSAARQAHALATN